jgi:hypothetical protein
VSKYYLPVQPIVSVTYHKLGIPKITFALTSQVSSYFPLFLSIISVALFSHFKEIHLTPSPLNSEFEHPVIAPTPLFGLVPAYHCYLGQAFYLLSYDDILMIRPSVLLERVLIPILQCIRLGLLFAVCVQNRLLGVSESCACF